MDPVADSMAYVAVYVSPGGVEGDAQSEMNGSKMTVESSIDVIYYRPRQGASFGRNYVDDDSFDRFSSNRSDYSMPVTLSSNGVLERELLGHTREESIEMTHVDAIQAEFLKIQDLSRENA